MAITLEEALWQGKVKIGDYVDYKPISGRCVLTKEQTGWEEDQAFEAEDLGWRVDKIEGDLVLIASRPTKDLYLKGKVGYEKGAEVIKTLCESCYSNLQFSQRVVPVEYEVRSGVVSSCHITDVAYWHIRRAFGNVDCVIIRDGLDFFNSMGFAYEVENGTGYHGVRPLVYLKRGICLEGGSGTEENPWKILQQQREELKADEEARSNLSIEEVERQLSEITEKLKTNAIQKEDFIKTQEEILRSLKQICISKYLGQIPDSMQ